MLIPDRVWQICSEYPHRIAIVHGDSLLTYAELQCSSAQFATLLNDNGVSPQSRVMLCMENSIEYVVAFYAIWRLGGIVVPVNARSTPIELRNIADQCNADLIVAQDGIAEKLKSSEPITKAVLAVKITGDVSESLNLSRHKPLSEQYSLKPDSIAQILYTSGTTGDPKGVVLSHQNLAVNTDDIVNYLHLSSQDSILTVLPFHFSYGNSVLHTHMSVGGQVVLGYQMAWPQRVVDGLRHLAVTGFSGVPTTFRSLVKVTDLASSPPPLRYVTQAGGPMGVELTKKLLRSLNGDTQLFVMYGQTEASARITYLPPEKLDQKLGSAGHALAHIALSIRDDDQFELPPGTVGEVYAQGENIMQGYWNNPGSTADVLTEHGLKTGDLGYMDDDGYLFITGRKVDMIKVAENRINPLEIEEAICQLDSVLEAAVIGVEDELTGQRLIACCVSRSDQKDPLEIKRQCAQRMVGYKVPKEIVWLDQLPKTASGKIQRYKLIDQLQGVSYA